MSKGRDLWRTVIRRMKSAYGFVPGLRPGLRIRWSGVNCQPLRAGSVFDRRGPRKVLVDGSLWDGPRRSKTDPARALLAGCDGIDWRPRRRKRFCAIVSVGFRLLMSVGSVVCGGVARYAVSVVPFSSDCCGATGAVGDEGWCCAVSWRSARAFVVPPA
jgi:hypothetical protein